MNCCDEFGNCNQGRDCPVRVARVGKVMHGPEPLPNSKWRDFVSLAVVWLLLALLGLAVWVVVLLVLL